MCCFTAASITDFSFVTTFTNIRNIIFAFKSIPIRIVLQYLHIGCIKKAHTIAKNLHVSDNAPLFYEFSQRSKTQEFYEKYKRRAKIEPKNAEMKRFHGMARARGYGLKSVSIQAKLTAIAVNLKRISRLISPKNTLIFKFLFQKSEMKIFYLV